MNLGNTPRKEGTNNRAQNAGAKKGEHSRGRTTHNWTLLFPQTPQQFFCHVVNKTKEGMTIDSTRRCLWDAGPHDVPWVRVRRVSCTRELLTGKTVSNTDKQSLPPKKNCNEPKPHFEDECGFHAHFFAIFFYYYWSGQDLFFAPSPSGKETTNETNANTYTSHTSHRRTALPYVGVREAKGKELLFLKKRKQ